MSAALFYSLCVTFTFHCARPSVKSLHSCFLGKKTFLVSRYAQFSLFDGTKKNFFNLLRRLACAPGNRLKSKCKKYLSSRNFRKQKSRFAIAYVRAQNVVYTLCTLYVNVNRRTYPNRLFSFSLSATLFDSYFFWFVVPSPADTCIPFSALRIQPNTAAGIELGKKWFYNLTWTWNTFLHCQ